jgi:hypothetical protein
MYGVSCIALDIALWIDKLKGGHGAIFHTKDLFGFQAKALIQPNLSNQLPNLLNNQPINTLFPLLLKNIPKKLRKELRPNGIH